MDLQPTLDHALRGYLDANMLASFVTVYKVWRSAPLKADFSTFLRPFSKKSVWSASIA